MARANGAGCMEPVVKNMTAPIFMARFAPPHMTMAALWRFSPFWEPSSGKRVDVAIEQFE
jgi:hypothetical protein